MSLLQTLFKILVFSFTVISTSFGMEITCSYKAVPKSCSSLRLKLDDVVTFKVKAVTKEGKPAFIKKMYGGSNQKSMSVGTFQSTVELYDAQIGTLITRFEADDGDGIGSTAGVSNYDDVMNIHLPVDKIPVVLSKGAVKFESIQVFYKGKEYTVNEAKKLRLKLGDVVTFKVKAVTKEGKPAFIKKMYGGSNQKSMSVGTFQSTAELYDAQIGTLITRFEADDGDGVGSNPGLSNYDEEMSIHIPVEKIPVTLSKKAVKFESIHLNVVPKKIDDNELRNQAIFDGSRATKPTNYVTPDKVDVEPNAVSK